MRNYLNLPARKPRTRKDMVEFLKNHPGHSDSWTGPIHFSRNVKISHLDTLTRDEDDACLKLIDEHYISYDSIGVSSVLEEFSKDHPGYVIYSEGRSNGHLALYNKSGGGFYPSRTDDYSDFEFSDLRDLFNAVWDFDQACQEAVDVFVDFATNWEIA